MNVVGLLARKFGIYLAAVLTAYLLAAVSASLHVASRLTAMGAAPTAAERISMVLHDLAGMAGTFLPLIAFALLAAFLVTALLYRLLRRGQIPLYVLAGAVALLALHLALNAAFGLTPVAAARTPGGLALQALAGAAGGWVYILLNRRPGSRLLGPDDA